MKIKTWLISAVILSIFSSCDDGDIIFSEFDFANQSLNVCEGASDLVFFKINSITQETVALNLLTTTDFFLEDGVTDITLSSSNFVTYRKFNESIDESYYCSSVPPSVPEVIDELLAENGVARLTNVVTLDDEDDVPEDEELIIDPMTDLPLDTDMDGIPDYFDFDDDGDNVPTILELFSDNADGDDNPLTPIKDTDNDGMPDYKDPDDDGDGILTRNESTDGNLSPLDDVTDVDSGIPDFLNSEVAIPGTNIQEFIEHSYRISADVNIFLFNITLANESEEITQDLDLGGVVDIINEIIILTPEF